MLFKAVSLEIVTDFQLQKNERYREHEVNLFYERKINFGFENWEYILNLCRVTFKKIRK